MARLPKHIIKKYGISKKAWAVFRGQKTTSKKVTSHKRTQMARKKHFKKGSKRSLNFGSVLKILSGAALAAAYEVFVSPMIPLSAMVKNIIELVIGLALAVMPGMPMIVRGFGAALATVNTYALVYPMIAGTASGSNTPAGLGW
jgi:hypothetical protein